MQWISKTVISIKRKKQIYELTFFAKDPSFTRNLAFYIFTATGNK